MFPFYLYSIHIILIIILNETDNCNSVTFFLYKINVIFICGMILFLNAMNMHLKYYFEFILEEII